MHLLQNAIGRQRRNIAPSSEQLGGALFNARGFTISVCHKLFERGKESVVIADLRPGLAHPWRSEQSSQDMAIQKGFHFGAEFLPKHTPVAIIFGVNEQRCNEIDILNVQLAARSDQKISPAIRERKLRLADAAMVPPGEVSVKIALRVIENKPDTAGMGKAALKC